MPQLTAIRARELLDYDRDTGVCVWKVRRSGVTVGIAGSLRPDGYVQIQIDGKRYGIHRVIYLMETGEWPHNQIDHRDLDRSNNRWDNIRPATGSQNRANRPTQKNNKSGFKGVDLVKGRYWRATIMVDGKHHHLGLFGTAEDAHAAYVAAAAKWYGEFHRAA
jgi:hypothetical protein